MSSVQLFSIASQKAQWLTEKQGVIASNIANASTTGYQSREIEPFSSILKSQASGFSGGLSRTHSKHLNAQGITDRSHASKGTTQSIEISHSGNSVSIEAELIKGSEVARSYALNANIVKSFHRMLLMSVKG